MFLLDAAAILLCLAAILGLINHHLLKLPFAIGMLVAGLLGSLGVLGLDALVPALDLAPRVRAAVLQVDFAKAVLSGMLSLLLFAGALHTDLGRLKAKAAPILTLATVGVVISTAVAGAAAWLVFGAVGLGLPFAWCLVFGALISPTDPIAVLGIMKAAGAPKELEIKVIGESLFNDGIGVVVYAVLLTLALSPDGGLGAGEVSVLLAKEVLGGVGLGLGVGLLAERALRTLDEANLEILITLAAVFGINLLATRLHVSAPLAAVVAGLLLGNRGRQTAMSAGTQSALDTVWTFIDEALNALLFLLIGVEFFAIDYSRSDYLIAAAVLVPAVLVARLVGVAVPVAVLRARLAIGKGTIRLLTWGGLKGGISIALAMKLPEFEGRNAVLTATYAVVVFSIVVQGLTVGPLIRRLTAQR
ncbi:MAG: sodium:proton antiporter [Myxococcales bacterium]|nr:sodium:proton antiporter [Myxococcales bacterium]